MVDRNKAAVIGAGAIGRGWSIVFARAGWHVALFSRSASTLDASSDAIRVSLSDLRDHGLLHEPPETIASRITCSTNLAEVLRDARYVQESIPENLDEKRSLFEHLDAQAEADAVLASSTSTLPVSLFAAHLKGRHRCVVAHPVNPPYLVPAVEVCPAAFTDEQVVLRTRSLLNSVGQAPIVLNKELPGFVMNRLQSLLACEAVRLVESGCVSPEDVDRAVKDGLGLRWAFMGPLETLDLNAAGGFADFARVFAPIMHGIDASPEAAPRPWSERAIATINAQRRSEVPLSEHAARIVWRDRRLMALTAHKRQAEQQANDHS